MVQHMTLSALISQLSHTYARDLGLSQRGLASFLHSCGFQDGLAALQEGRVNCNDLARCCRPVLDRLQEAPPEGWLRFFYDELSAGLFPDPHRPAPTQAQRTAQAFFLEVLEWLLSRETLHCPFDPLLDLHWANEEELASSRLRTEYASFRELMTRDHFPTLLRIGRDCMPFDPASHTIGVNNVAVHAARLAKEAGIQVDIPLVSAAAMSHDIGKFGCRGRDARRIPYLHYYFTWQYLSQQDLPHIAHVAANHSTWDLEFENLPVESLLLIYADFRVRGQRDESGHEVTKIYSLAESYAIILSKLADVTAEKHRRYATVYAKLRDFERFLSSRGICPDMEVTSLLQTSPKAPALCSGPESMEELRNLVFDNSIRLMDTFSTDASFEELLEQAKAEKNLQRIRTYLLLFEEYNTYMPRHSKGMTLNFLYELLMHREGDVRRRAAAIIGRILANSGPSYRKELPADAPATAYAPTLMGYFAEAQELWAQQIQLCLHPDRKISAKHAQRIADSLKVIADSLFDACSDYDAQVMAQPLLALLPQAQEEDRLPLICALAQVPPKAIAPEAMEELTQTLLRFLNSGDEPLQLTTLQTVTAFLDRDPGLTETFVPLLKAARCDTFAPAYRRAILLNRCGCGEPLPEADTRELFLNNLKSAVHWTVKLVTIDYLRDRALQNPSATFHTVTHLSNLLCVSEHLPVREYAGQALLQLLPALTVDQCNEILVDLTRELETGQEQISYYIAPVLGRLLCQMPHKELSEGVDYLDDLIHAGSPGSLRAALAALNTLGSMLAAPQCWQDEPVRQRVLSLLLTGIAHYEPTIHQTALTVLFRKVFGNSDIPLEIRRDYLVCCGKKLLCMLSEPVRQQLTFYNHAAMLNHLYRLLVSCEMENVPLNFPEPRPVAFFPGTFDPFSTGHKEIVRAIRELGFEVYLAIDEFSWSKRTVPKLLRRKIAAISVADQWDVYLFPDDTAVNIAIAEDLAALANLFPGRKLYLVAGSDVIEGASAYRSEEPGSARYYNHVIFHRADSKIDEEKLRTILRGDFQLMRLPAWCDNVSSTRIREDVDKNLDISTLVDPIVQSFIYDNRLYLRSPQFKGELAPGDLYFARARRDLPLPAALRACLDRYPDSTAVFLMACSSPAPLGWSCGHTITSSQLLESLGSPDAAAYVRQHTSGRILLVDHAAVLNTDLSGIHRKMVGELLARSLETDHTYALCRCAPMDPMFLDLMELGFQPIPGQPDLLYVDMRAPVVLIQDVLLSIKEPLRSDPEVVQTVERTRHKLRKTLASLYPGRLLLTFDEEMLSQSLSRRAQAHNPPLPAKPGTRPLGAYMCVPYGKALADEVVPGSVTKTLHSDRVYDAGLRRFTITQSPGYSSLEGQVRTIKSFRRPVILVDDLMHRGHRMAELDHIFKEEQVEIRAIIVGLLSGQGRDLMLTQGRTVDCEYYIPNLCHWLNESSLYPFLGGDSVDRPLETDWTRPAINMVLPYVNPTFLPDSATRLRLSLTALENARDILKILEQRHLATFSTILTLERLAEALFRPRFPDRGDYLRYDLTVPASQYVAGDLTQLERISMTEDIHGL